MFKRIPVAKSYLIALLICAQNLAFGEVIWDNGNFVTNPGEGFGGADVSLNSSGKEDVAGDNIRKLNKTDPWFRIADDFSVDETFLIDRILTFGYEPLVPEPQWESANLKIWNGPPWSEDSEVIFSISQSPIEMVFTGVYRVFNTEELTSTERPIFEINWDLGAATLPSVVEALVLAPGDYWIDWQVQGGTTGWANPVMALGENPSEPITVIDNGKQLRPIGWVPTGDVGREIPFVVMGRRQSIFSDSFE